MKVLQRIYIIITSVLVMAITTLIFSVYHFNNLRSWAFLILVLVILDILCTIFEVLIVKIQKKHILNKSKRAEKRIIKSAEHKQKNYEAKKTKEDMKKALKNPDYKKVLDAEVFIKKVQKLSESYDFGAHKKNITICVDKISEIISILKNDCSGYNRVSFLFEKYLPEFYTTLKYYSNFIIADIVSNEQERTLSKCINKFLDFLQSQKIEALFDRTETETQFKNASENLNKMIDGGENL